LSLLEKDLEIGNSLSKSLGIILKVVDAAGSVGTSELSAAGGQVGLQAIPVPHKGVNLGLGTIDSQRQRMSLAPASGQLVLELSPGRGMNNHVAHTFQSPEQALFHCPAPSLSTI
jgi:hypothetical protein